jgi:FtsP/CotA-like multicopper oxidase with cupredoxin domain
MKAACRAFAVLVAVGCGDGIDAGGPSSPFQTAGDFADLDPEPNGVRVQLVAAASEVEILTGKSTAVWAYRDGARPGARASVPGPLLDLREGQSVVVEFENQLEVETTVHWHGLRLEAAMDGSNVSQRPVVPGETFTYRFVARDPGFPARARDSSGTTRTLQPTHRLKRDSRDRSSFAVAPRSTSPPSACSSSMTSSSRATAPGRA